MHHPKRLTNIKENELKALVSDLIIRGHITGELDVADYVSAGQFEPLEDKDYTHIFMVANDELWVCKVCFPVVGTPDITKHTLPLSDKDREYVFEDYIPIITLGN